MQSISFVTLLQTLAAKNRVYFKSCEVQQIVLLVWVEFNLEIIDMGHTDFLVRVETLSVQEPGSSPKLS